MANTNPIVYNSQLVSHLTNLLRFHTAHYGPEDAFTLYHIIQEEAPNAASAPILPALGHALAGSIATAGAKALLYPLELVITRLQVQRQLRGKGEAESAARDADAEYAGLLDAGMKIYKNEGGLKAFYTGCAPDVGKGIADSFLFFLGYTLIRQWELRKAGSTGHLPVSKELGVGIAAGALAKAFTTPIQNIVTRQQTAALVAARDPSSSTTVGDSSNLSIKDIFLQIRSEHGLAGFWNGYSASVVLTLNPALTFAVDNLLKRLLPKSRRDNPSPQLIFLIAAVSKAIATTLTYPAMLAKSRAQTAGPKAPDVEEEKKAEETIDGEPEILSKSEFNSTPRRRQTRQQLQKLLGLFQHQYALLLSIRKIYREEGLGGLYSGLEAEVLKGFLQHGLTMALKEKVFVGVVQVYYLLLRVTRKWDGELRKAQEVARERAGEVGEKVKEGVEGVVEGVKRE